MDSAGSLQQKLQQFAAAGLNGRIGALQDSSHALSDLRVWIEQSLGNYHLVDIAHSLQRTLAATLEEMLILGLPVDILELFPGWREGRREGFSVPPVSWSLPSAGARYPIRALRLQLSPFSVTLSAAILLIRHLLAVMDDTVLFQVAVEPGGNPDAIAALIAEFHPTAAERLTIVELETSTVFAQDNARGVRTLEGKSALVLPRGFGAARNRGRDAMESQITGYSGPLPVYLSRLFWEGGNIVSDDTACLVGADTLYENMSRLGLAREEVYTLFAAEFGTAVHFLGDCSVRTTARSELQDFTTGQASFHIDLDVSLLGRPSGSQPVALLADPGLALPHLDTILQQPELVQEHYLEEDEARELIAFEYASYAEARSHMLSRYRQLLLDLGYIVVGVPDVRIDPSENLFSTRNLDFTYCNIISGLQRGAPTIFYLPSGIPVLDALAARHYAASGCASQSISRSGRLGNLLMLFRGGLRCACSAIQ